MLPKQACMCLRETTFIIDRFNNLKNETECHHLQNSSQSTAGFESILLKTVLKIAGQLYRQQEEIQELHQNWKKEDTGNEKL